MGLELETIWDENVIELLYIICQQETGGGMYWKGKHVGMINDFFFPTDAIMFSEHTAFKIFKKSWSHQESFHSLQRMLEAH